MTSTAAALQKLNDYGSVEPPTTSRVNVISPEAPPSQALFPSRTTTDTRPKPHTGRFRRLLGLLSSGHSVDAQGTQLDNLRADGRFRDDEDVEATLPVEGDRDTKITLPPIDCGLFRTFVPRGSPPDYERIMSSKDTQHLAEYMETTKSTATDLEQWLQRSKYPQMSKGTDLSPMFYLFTIIYRDTLDVLHLMDLALTEMSHDILDDSLIQQRLVHWRHLLERFEIELRQLQSSLQSFATFISAPEGTNPVPPATIVEQSPMEPILQDGRSRIADLRQRTADSYRSLMANMSIIESKRGIAEAESVTKLTELAFFFIPLTFSASVFSMQVKELDTRVSLWVWFLMALIVTMSSYALRLLIRSSFVLGLKKRCLDDVRADANLPLGAPIPSRFFFAWVWHRVGVPPSFALALAAVLAGPLVAMWTRPLRTGIKLGITIVICFLYIWCLLTVYFLSVAGRKLGSNGRRSSHSSSHSSASES